MKIKPAPSKCPRAMRLMTYGARVKKGCRLPIRQGYNALSKRCEVTTLNRKRAIAKSAAIPIISAHPMATRSATTAAARNAVLRTQELLEEILAHLPVKSLWTVQRVCKRWSESVSASPRLRKSRFLKVESNLILTLNRATKTIKLLAKSPAELSFAAIESRPNETPIHVATLNPIFFAPLPDSERPHLVERCEMCETLALTMPPDRGDPCTFVTSPSPDDEAATHVRQKKSDMFVANPPPSSVELEVAFTFNAKRGRRLGSAPQPERHTVKNEDGVSWGDVVREMDVVLHVAKFRLRRIGELRDAEGLILDGQNCKVWMRGVVFLTEWEREVLVKGGMLGEKGVVHAKKSNEKVPEKSQ